ncbi:MAG TPA: lysophospholipid acyltransferase family protein [Myxococcaceae bacterium]|nr:lysophospholipid acyltransferase family protein [Myxococcaceae bacterium]
MRWLRSVLFWAFFVASSAVLFFVALAIFLLTFPFDRNGKVLHLFSCGWAQLYFWVNPGWRLRVEGRERLPWSGPAVLVSNHQSLGDILVLFGLFRPFKWVSKASVFKAPFLGWNMYLNRYVGLVRGDKDSIARMMAACEQWLERGVPVLLFPEGTRSPDGNLLPFKDGAFRLAQSKGCPLYPIVLTGTADTLPKHGLVLKGRANCRVRVLEPVDPRAFADVDSLREHVRQLIAQEKARLESEGMGELQTA